MDPDTLFVHYFCNQVAKIAKAYSEIRAWYIWGDKRPGTPIERLEQDASSHAEYTKLFKP